MRFGSVVLSERRQAQEHRLLGYLCEIPEESNCSERKQITGVWGWRREVGIDREKAEGIRHLCCGSVSVSVHIFQNSASQFT